MKLFVINQVDPVDIKIIAVRLVIIRPVGEGEEGRGQHVFSSFHIYVKELLGVGKNKALNSDEPLLSYFKNKILNLVHKVFGYSPKEHPCQVSGLRSDHSVPKIDINPITIYPVFRRAIYSLSFTSNYR